MRPELDLMPAPVRRQRVFRRRVRIIGAALGAYAVVIAGACCVALAPVGSEGPPAEVRLANLTSHLAALNQSINQRRAALDAELRRRELARASLRHPDWGMMVEVLSSATPGQAAVDAITLAPPDSSEAVKPGEERLRLELTGVADTQATVAEFVGRLEGLGLFTRVVLVESTAAALGEHQTINFRVRCELTGGIDVGR